VVGKEKEGGEVVELNGGEVDGVGGEPKPDDCRNR